MPPTANTHHPSPAQGVSISELETSDVSTSVLGSLSETPKLQEAAIPLVSIIIPCYNAEKYVAEAIQSALDQIYPNCEVIVIDDGSTDNSLEVIKSFGDRISWETGPNRGGNRARNSGLEISRGQWIQFFDSDDILTQNCVSKLMAAQRQQAEMVCCEVQIMGEFKTSQKHPFWNHERYDLEHLFARGCPPTACCLFPRERLVKIGGFTDDLPCSQEYDLYLRYAIQYNTIFVSNNSIGLHVRPVARSVSRSHGVMMPLTIARVVISAEELANRHGLLNKQLKTAIAGHLSRISSYLWRINHKKDALEILSHAQKLGPDWHEGYYHSKIFRLCMRCFGFKLTEAMRMLARLCLGRWKEYGK